VPFSGDVLLLEGFLVITLRESWKIIDWDLFPQNEKKTATKIQPSSGSSMGKENETQ